jgi:hypothetical protein
MPAAELVVFSTIALAVVAWAGAELLASRMLWMAGALLALVHAGVAFAVFYEGSHAVAREQTSRQTEALTGFAFSGGIYINYLFLAVWLGDAAWWGVASKSYAERPGWVSSAIRGFIFFIILNGAVIFADGWARAVGVVAVTAVVLSTWRRRRI